MKKFSRQEIDHLAEKLRSDALTTEDHESIKEIIRHHPAARRRLVENLYLAANLKDTISNWQGEVPELSPARTLARRGWIPAVALAAAAMLMLLVWQPWSVERPGKPGEIANQSEEELDSQGIAVVSMSSQVEWGPGTTLSAARLEGGLPVGPGVIEIEDGVAQIDFYSGASVVLQGPARLSLLSPDHGSLDFGILRAQVPLMARGFRIESEFFEVVDLGTEFGMIVERGGVGEVHVIDGEVEVHSARDSSSAPRLVKGGRGVTVTEGGSISPIVARPGDFITSRNLSKVSQLNYLRWQSFQTVLLEEPDVLVAYTFPDYSSWERVVVNRALHGPASTDGMVVGSEWTEGRWPGKGALRFRNSSHRIRLHLPGQYEELTLSAWVRLDQLKQREISLLHPDTSQERFLHWTLVRAGEDALHMHFSETVKDGTGKGRRNYFHCDANLLGGEQGVPLGEWRHLAVVYDAGAGQVIFYQNGVAVGSRSITERRPLSVGTADIGNWPYQEWAKGTEFEVRNLNGAIDEFLIMQRAWSGDEVRVLWEAGVP